MSASDRSVVVIGGANGERIYELDAGEYVRDSKISKAPTEQTVFAGGSGINHSCRLLALGVDVEPILPRCADDVGQLIVETLEEAARVGNATVELSGVKPLETDAPTPFSTIVTEGPSRTVLNHFSEELIAPFEDLFSACFNSIQVPSAIMIGHIHADRSESPGVAGAITQTVVEQFRDSSCILFANFGGSQYRQGAGRWRRLLQSVHVFQLDLSEVRTFCSSAIDGPMGLKDILDWFRDVCTVVVTLERFGAIGQRKGSHNVVFAWPYDISARDTTGAGDAFGAGVVYHTLAHRDGCLGSEEGFRDALCFGRLCGAYACGCLGGANQCPSRSQLDDFAKRPTNRIPMEEMRRHGSIQTIDEAQRDLWLLDRAFPHR